jgi:hypothetical protein
MKTPSQIMAKKNRGLDLSAHGSFPLADGHDSIRQTL